MMNKKPIAVFMAFILTFGTLSMSAAAEKSNNNSDDVEAKRLQEIKISTPAEFNDFSEKCKSASWSKDKKIVLTADIDFLTESIVSVPIFAGEFDGQGHSLNNVLYEGKQSYEGVFSQTTAAANIHDLSVKGVIHPKGKAFDVGGLVGKNYGLVEKCDFSGVVEGYNYVGGIVGYNEETGQIKSCRNNGKVNGTFYTGGIAGANFGQVESCVNKSGINTQYHDKTIAVDDINIDQMMNSVLRFSDDEDERKTPISKDNPIDTGGIVGYNTGQISSCTNEGAIGYKHVGYNVGGVAGRHTGFISNCTNKGIINGRKDVGGIVGQAEPKIDIDEDADSLEKLNKKIDSFHSSLERAIDSSENVSDVVSKRLDIIGEYADKAEDNTSNVSDQIVGDNSAVEKISDSSSELGRAFSSFKDSTSRVDLSKYLTEEEKAEFEKVMSSVEDALGSYETSLNEYVNNPEFKAEFATASREKKAKLAVDAVKYALYMYEMNHQGKSYIEYMTEYNKKLAKYGFEIADSLGDAGEDLKKGATRLEKAAGKFGDAGEQLGSEYVKSNADELSDNLKGISDNLDILNSEINDSTQDVSDDLKAVNDDLNAILQSFTDTIDDALSVEKDDVYTDYSQDVAEECQEATIEKSLNSNEVLGDINVGGIAGTMAREYEFDLESDATGIQDGNLISKYRTKCVLRDATNRGRVESKKSCAGGIVGLQELGTVLRGQNYSKIVSVSGDYVGGIAGQSFGTINNCYEKSLLQGESYIGGIVGQGADVSLCMAMPVVLEGEAFIGGIAGDVSDDAVVSNNIFVSNELAGIDRVSYENIAEPVFYTKLLEDESLPKDFQKLQITFSVDDEEVGTLTKSYGDTLDSKEFPQVVETSGEIVFANDNTKTSAEDYIVWEDVPDGELVADLEISGELTRYNKTLASELLRDGRQSVLLVDGTFTEKDTFEVEQKSVKKTDFIELYDTTIPADGNEVHMMRYQLPKDVGKVSIYVKDAKCTGKKDYRRVKTSMMGQFITFETAGNKVVVGIELQNRTQWYLLGVFAAIVIVSITIIIIRTRMKKKKVEA